MKIRGEEPENSHREEAIACVVRLVARWRAEVHNRRVLQRAALSRLVDKWEEAKLEPGLLLYIVAATEWLFRARPPTPEDITAELLDLLARLSNPRTGPLEVDQASLVVEALRGSLEKELAGRRFLVSLQLWAVRDRFSRWRLLGRGRPRPGDAASFRTVVEKKPGPIRNVGPIVAGVAAEGVAVRAGVRREVVEQLGSAISGVLLGRPVQLGEYRRWRSGFSLAGPAKGDPLADWFSKRLERGYRLAPDHPRWAAATPDVGNAQHPFGVVASPAALSQVYALPWLGQSTSDPASIKRAVRRRQSAT